MREEGRVGGGALPIAHSKRIFATSRPLPPPGSPFRCRARGSPTSPQGGGRLERRKSCACQALCETSLVQPVDCAAFIERGDEARVVEILGLVLLHLGRVVDRE